MAVFFGGLWMLHGSGAFGEGAEWGPLQRGWGVPTATDIALAWLVARAVFGKGHAAVNYLLLLAVADDAIGLGIIAIFYGDPAHPAQPQWLLLVALAMGAAFAMRKANVRSWVPYVFIAGTISWCVPPAARWANAQMVPITKTTNHPPMSVAVRMAVHRSTRVCSGVKASSRPRRDTA